MIKEYSINFNKASVNCKAYRNYVGDQSYPFYEVVINPIWIRYKKSGIESKIPIPIDEILRTFEIAKEDYDYKILDWDLQLIKWELEKQDEKNISK